MDFVISYFFTNATLTSCPIFFILSSLLVTWSFCCCTHPKVMTNWKKGATGWSCIRKEVTSYKIHTLRAYCPNIYTVPSGTIFNDARSYWIEWPTMVLFLTISTTSFFTFSKLSPFSMSSGRIPENWVLHAHTQVNFYQSFSLN